MDRRGRQHPRWGWLAAAAMALILLLRVTVFSGGAGSHKTVPTPTPPTLRAFPPRDCSDVRYSLNWCGWRTEATETFPGTKLSNAWFPAYTGTGNEGVGQRVASLVSVDNGLQIGAQTLKDPKLSGGIMMRRAWTYGRFEVRARTGRGAGTGPALLLETTGKWPDGGELDLSEQPTGTRKFSVFTDHYSSADRIIQRGWAGDFTRWHTFVLVWEPTFIRMYIDGRPVKKITKPAAIPTLPMRLALQIDCGPNKFITAPNAVTPETVYLDVSEVRVAQG